MRAESIPASPTGRFARNLLHFSNSHIVRSHGFAIPRRDAPGLCVNSSPQERAWGMPGARCTRSLVCSVLVAHECRHHGRTGITRHSRTRMVLTAYFVISPAIGLSCHRHLADTSAKLDAGVEASGPHDFAVR